MATNQRPELGNLPNQRLSRRSLLHLAAGATAAGLLTGCVPISRPVFETTKGRFEIGDFIVATEMAKVYELPGSQGKSLGQIDTNFTLAVLSDPVLYEGMIFWQIGGISAEGRAVIGWVAERDAKDEELLTYPAKLPGTNIPDKSSQSYLAMPFAGVFPITQLFGENPEFYSQISYDGVPLKGNIRIDFALSVGVDVLAVDEGVISALDHNDQDGNYVRMTHPWGESVYTHLDNFASVANPGQTVPQGTVLGKSGASGVAFAPFLGFSLRVTPFQRTDGWGGFVDPLAYFKPRSLALPSYIVGTSPLAQMQPIPEIIPAAVVPMPSNLTTTGIGGTYVIFDLCIRDGACAEVCPVECIVPGYPAEEWPWYYVDPDTCISCRACVEECPVGAVLSEGELTPETAYATELNALFFTEGPGYSALNMTE